MSIYIDIDRFNRTDNRSAADSI
ncbi:unnamed protein product [Ectocarpus sp. CCAP 1310/34]|nr:unnamed protein product [Ectocarpus sp. CCAP 1310/34]